jgi:hypothetical protein
MAWVLPMIPQKGQWGVAGRGLGEAAGRALPQWRAKPAHQYRRAERGPLKQSREPGPGLWRGPVGIRLLLDNQS